MKPMILFFLCAFPILWCQAGGENYESEGGHTGTHLYLTPKLFFGGGATTNGIRGQESFGGAIDFGIQPRRWKHLSIEVSGLFSQGQGIATGGKTKAAIGQSEQLTYTGLGVMLVYLKHFSWFTLVGKAGLKSEWERATVDSKIVGESSGTGLGYGFGMEIPISKGFEFVVEAEQTTIDSPIGLGVVTGFKVRFD